MYWMHSILLNFCWLWLQFSPTADHACSSWCWQCRKWFHCFPRDVWYNRKCSFVTFYFRGHIVWWTIIKVQLLCSVDEFLSHFKVLAFSMDYSLLYELSTKPWNKLATWFTTVDAKSTGSLILEVWCSSHRTSSKYDWKFHVSSAHCNETRDYIIVPVIGMKLGYTGGCEGTKSYMIWSRGMEKL